MTDPLQHQVGGDHYRQHAVQPIAFAMGNRLCAAQAYALKHLSRPRKGQIEQDLQKCLHYLEFLAVPDWPRVSLDEYIEGLSPDVPRVMRDAAAHVAQIHTVEREWHLAEARALLQQALAHFRSGGKL